MQAVGLVLFAPMSLLAYSTFPKARVRSSLCAQHAAAVKSAKLLVIAPVVFTSLMMLCVFLAIVGILPANNVGLMFGTFGGMALGVLLSMLAVIHSITLDFPVTVFRHQRGYFWLSGAPPEFVELLPDVSEAQAS